MYPSAGDPAHARQAHIGADAMRLDQGFFLAVFRRKGQALRLHFRRGWRCYELALNQDLPAVAGVCAEEGA